MELDGRTVSGGYRFGYQNQEKDDEIKGEGNSVNYTFRMHDPRLGRFFAVDPLTAKYSYNSPYSFSENKVIAWGELEGREAFFAADGTYLGQIFGSTEVRIVKQENIKAVTEWIAWANGTAMVGRDEAAIWNTEQAVQLSHLPSSAEAEKLEIDPVISKTTHESYRTHGDCNAAATATLENAGYKAGEFWGKDAQYQFQMYKDPNSSTPNVDIIESRKNGFEKINSELEAGRPVMIGVDYQNGSSNPNTDGTTDHFIILTGRGIDKRGKLFYTADENVDNNSVEAGTSKTQNRFYLQPDQTLKGGTCYRGGMQVTQVRPVKKK